MLQVGTFEELLSHVFGGCILKATTPRQHRMGVNLRSYQSRAREIASDLGEMVDGGHYKVRPIAWIDDDIDVWCDMWPTAFLPSWSAPTGGTDKPGKPQEKRRLADGSAPRDVCERNDAHGAPSGPPAVDFNTLSGPMRPQHSDVCPTRYELVPYGSLCCCCFAVVVSDSTQGRHMWWGALVCCACVDARAWEHLEPLKWFKESKHTVKSVYQASAALGAIADVAQLGLFSVQDDYRWMFWYFGLHPSEFPNSVQYAIVLLAGRYAWCLVVQLVCDMGRSPISNICSHVSLKHVSSWAEQMDVLMPAVELSFDQNARDLLAQRRERLGDTQGRAFWGSSYTDDVILLTIGERATVVATHTWDRSCYKCNIRMTDFEKRRIGTAPLHIGARFVLNAHFGCVPPVKRARCLEGIRAALEQRAVRDDFESNCGLIGHIAQTLDIERSLLHGIKRPLDIAPFPTSIIFLTVDGASRHLELEFLISTRNAASFASAVADASLVYDVPARPAFSAVEIRMGSDACTFSERGVRHPAVFGMCHEFAYVFYLTGRWLEVPITGTESLGAILDLLVFPPIFPWARMVNETDASSAHALLLGRSRSPPLQRAYRILRSQPAFQAAMPRVSSQLVAGEQHVMVDAGSRGYQDVLAGWLAALNMRIRFLTISAETLVIVDQILAAMLDGDPAQEEFDRDTAGTVAFYSDADEVIRFVLTGSPQLPPPVRRPSLPSRSPASAPPQLPSAAAFASPNLPRRPPPASFSAPAAPPLHVSPTVPPSSAAPPPRLSSPSAVPPAPASSYLGPRASPRVVPPAPTLTHERPRSAATFRALGAERLAHRLCMDTSAWRLCPGDPSLLRQAVLQVAQARAKRIPRNTDRANDNGIRWFGRACDMLGTPIERPSAADADPVVEAFLAAYAVYFTAMEMQPAERSAVTQLGGVRKTRADPSSALSAYYGARRVLDDFGSYLPPMKSVLQCLKGLRVMMIEDFGDDCFSKVQAQPWPQKYLDRIMTGCATYSMLFWSPAQHDSFLDAFLLSLSLGARKAELPRYRLSNVVWLDPDMVEGKATTDWLARVSDGWWCRMAPVCSKTDYDNAKYGSTRMWFKVGSSDPWNIAARLIARERRFPCAPDLRSSAPLLLDPSTMAAVTGNTLVAWLDEVKGVYVDPADAKLAARLTWHASRVTLASKLVKLKQPWERVQTLIRWESIASARIYGRAEAEAYHADVAAALAADAAGVTGLREIDPVSAMNDIDAALASEGAAQADAASARAAEASELRGVDKPAKVPRRASAPKPAAAPGPAPPRRPPAPLPVAASTPAPPPPPPRSVAVSLAGGRSVECFASDSWRVTGESFSIPESVWTLDSADAVRLRYVVVGLACPSGSPCFVVKVTRGERAGECYVVQPHIVRSLMGSAVRRRAGSSLARDPVAI